MEDDSISLGKAIDVQNKWAMVFVATWVLALIAFYLIVTTRAPDPKFYDCSMSETHPDYQAQMRKQCRLIRAGVRLI